MSVATGDVHNRAVIRAAELLGGAAALAQRLGVPESTVQQWIAERFIPSDALLRIVDIIIDHDIDAQASQRKEA